MAMRRISSVRRAIGGGLERELSVEVEVEVEVVVVVVKSGGGESAM